MQKGNVAFKRGDIFNSPMQTLTNTTNTFGVMGAGLAKQFKDLFPGLFEDYRKRVEHRQVQVGKPYLWKPSDPGGRWVLNFPTKQHWREKSRLEWVEEGLHFLLAHYEEWGILSLAMPALGCGHGGLPWAKVRPRMELYVSQMDIPVEIYEPFQEKQHR